MYKKAYEELNRLCLENINFKNLVEENIKNGKVRFFGNEEWMRIKKQNYISLIPDDKVKDFSDVFKNGYNIGDCVNVSLQLSYSYDDVDIVSGILPILKGSRNATLVGGHRWLENSKEIIDTTLMLIIDKSLKKDFGYIEEGRISSFTLRRMHNYMARKEFVNDSSIKRSL